MSEEEVSATGRDQALDLIPQWVSDQTNELIYLLHGLYHTCVNTFCFVSILLTDSISMNPGTQ